MLLYQPQDGYCYNSDTHFLHHFINTNLKIFKNIKGELLDIGSGSGILGLLVARDNPRLNLNQCEVQDKFQELTKINSKNNKIESRIYKGKYQDISFDKTFDICVSNPPFYHTNVVKTENENIKIARYNDSMPLVDFISKTSKVLNQNGKFFFCYDVKQLNDIMHLLNEYKLNIESMQFVHPKLGKDATLVLIYARKNSKSLMRILSPLIVFDEKDFTKEVQDIYKVSSTHSIKVDI
ncbi:tRNA1(Val) (adenine(37)-N6)-methyltransferase [Arcobacter sp. F2176]|uniref:tRNA1(Val) (adenine(37)-N6)-methyltransferase n=1 Tax=Arcobacter sp. F2176 TaxID=2044511 RepID=UPI00100A40B4|nr:methyltransferase [Arcobacter sp. F2176]RXJ79255.1 methyltransferase [Arcobacter sp. F2176]